jgi:hypothetical protein
MGCTALLTAAFAACAGITRVQEDGAGSYVPPGLVLARPWTLLGYAPPYQVTIDPSAIESRDGKVEVWLMLNFSYRTGEEDWTTGSLMQRLRIDCARRSFQVDEEHEFSLPMGGGFYRGGMGSFWGGRALARRHPPGWNEDLLPGTPAALAASRVCATP